MTPLPQPQQERQWIVTETALNTYLGKWVQQYWDVAKCVREWIMEQPSRPTPQLQGKLVYSSAPWKIYEQDAGMGEKDYAVMLNDVFYCRTDDSQTAMKIVEAICSRPYLLEVLEKWMDAEFSLHRAYPKERMQTFRNSPESVIKRGKQEGWLWCRR